VSGTEESRLGGRLPLIDYLQMRGVPWADFAVARHSGIPDDAVRCVAAGTLPESLSDDEKVANCFARQLSTSHRIDDATFSQARKAFGDRGIVDLIVLAGTYYTVCGLLNAFTVPTPSESPENPN
jgi:4-carboxymuconolactone decarboxylase